MKKQKKQKTKQKIHTCFSVFVRMWVSKRKRKKIKKRKKIGTKKYILLNADVVFFLFLFHLNADGAILTTHI